MALSSSSAHSPGFVGELAGGDNATCNAAVKDMPDSMMSASDVLIGWTF